MADVLSYPVYMETNPDFFCIGYYVGPIWYLLVHMSDSNWNVTTAGRYLERLRASPVCRNCGRVMSLHAQDRCLFGSTSFEQLYVTRDPVDCHRITPEGVEGLELAWQVHRDS